MDNHARTHVSASRSHAFAPNASATSSFGNSSRIHRKHVSNASCAPWGSSAVVGASPNRTRNAPSASTSTRAPSSTTRVNTRSTSVALTPAMRSRVSCSLSSPKCAHARAMRAPSMDARVPSSAASTASLNSFSTESLNLFATASRISTARRRSSSSSSSAISIANISRTASTARAYSPLFVASSTVAVAASAAASLASRLSVFTARVHASDASHHADAVFTHLSIASLPRRSPSLDVKVAKMSAVASLASRPDAPSPSSPPHARSTRANRASRAAFARRRYASPRRSNARAVDAAASTTGTDSPSSRSLASPPRSTSFSTRARENASRDARGANTVDDDIVSTSPRVEASKRDARDDVCR